MHDAAPNTWRIISATTQGAGHVRSGQPNQDCCDSLTLSCGVQVIAVADGAGSRSRSDRGARLAVDGALAATKRRFAALPDAVDKEGWRTAADEWARDCVREFEDRLANEIAELAQPADPEVRGSYATTLMAVAWRSPWYAMFAVGDCFLVVDRAPGGSYLIWPTDFRDNAGVTVFMTSASRDEEIRTDVLMDPHLRGLALCSDGLAEATLTVRPTSDGGHRFVVPRDFTQYFDVFAAAANDDAVLQQRITSPAIAGTSSDDKTMVIAVRTR
jgi:hypothetical protein